MPGDRIPDHALQNLIDWSRGFLKRKRATRPAGEAAQREHDFALQLWDGVTTALVELQGARKTVAAAEDCVKLLEATHERLLTLCDQSKAASHEAVTAEVLMSTLKMTAALAVYAKSKGDT